MNGPSPYFRTAVTLGAILGVMLTALTAGCGFGAPEPDERSGSPRFPTPSAAPIGDGASTAEVASVIATGLRVPWDVDFLPDGAALVTERDTARIVQVGPESDPGGLRVTVLQTIDEARPRGEGGLLGIAVSPEYGTDQTIFIYYTTPADNRIARLTLGGRPEPIVTGIPAGNIHNGGQLAFGPDGFLYASTGEAGDPPSAQKLDSLGGKILRMTTDGRPAPGNPFDDSLIWSYGHRNVQGLAWDPDGRLWATEFGASAWDEMNLVEPGANYGWPVVEGIGGDERYTDPVVVWETAEASCSGAAMVGRVLVAACLRGQRLWLMELTGSGSVLGQPRAALKDGYGRLRGAATAPDGSLWITTSNHDGRLRDREPHPEDDRVLRLVLPAASGIGQS